MRFACLLALLVSSALQAGEVKHGHPESYRRLLGELKAGDTLVLAAGVYDHGLPVTGVHGTEDEWITIQGPEAGVAEIRQTQVANCVELRQCSHVALKRLSILGGGPKGRPGLFGISAQGGLKNSVHHILIEDCMVSDWNTSQQAVGISTKTPTWGWVIRRNVIRNCGTGLYLGNSNGADPFIGGLIANNLVVNPVGYCMEIKYQKPRPVQEGMPQIASRTIIRDNVFIKGDGPSPDGNRANVLVGGFPNEGPGSQDVYEIYGNFFWHNPRESLLQVSGRVTIHDNVFGDCADAGFAAIMVRDHDLPVKRVHIYNNTLFAAARGVRFASAASEGHAVLGNVIFADEPLSLHASVTQVSENITAPVKAAAEHVKRPVMVLGELDLHPLPGRCEGVPLNLKPFERDTYFTLDFDGRDKGMRHRGAYAGPGEASAFRLQEVMKPQF
ncbi:MAG: hypothetical protein V4662_20630 [Verrucomicrobiota bacterium]